MFVHLLQSGWIPQKDGSPEWWNAAGYAGACLVGGLAIGVGIGNTLKWIANPALAWIRKLRLRKAEGERFRRYMPHLTERERRIFSYRLANNRKAFETARSGEHAMMLISQGFLRFENTANMVAMPVWATVVVPDEVWQVLERNRADFKYMPARDGAEGAPPWRRSMRDRGE